MTFKLRLAVWLTVALLIPVLILVIYGEYSGFWWTLFIAVLGGGYETWHYFNTRNK